MCDLVAVWEDPSVAVSVGKQRSVQLEQIPMKPFNSICASLVGALRRRREANVQDVLVLCCQRS